jgi:hypothetical protein
MVVDESVSTAKLTPSGLGFRGEYVWDECQQVKAQDAAQVHMALVDYP